MCCHSPAHSKVAIVKTAAEHEQNANSRVLQASDVPPARVAIESLTCFGTAALRVQRLKYVPGSKSQLKELRPKG